MRWLAFISMLLLCSSATAQSFEPFQIGPRVFPDSMLFGYSVMSLGDLDGNGAMDFAIGSPGDNYSPAANASDLEDSDGSFRVFMMATETEIQSVNEFSYEPCNDPSIPLCGGVPWDSLGAKIHIYDDVNGDGISNLVVGDDGHVGNNARFELGSAGAVTEEVQFVNYASVAMLGDIDGNGFSDYISISNDRPNPRSPADSLGKIRLHLVDPDFSPSFVLAFNEEFSTRNIVFGYTSKSLGDLNGDGLPEIAISDENAIWIISLNANHEIAWRRKILAEHLGLPTERLFGKTFEFIGGPGSRWHLLVSSPTFDGPGLGDGALHLLRLSDSGEVAEHSVIHRSSFPSGVEFNLDGHVSLSVESMDSASSEITLLMGLPYANVLGTRVGAVHRVRINADLSVTPILTLSNETLGSAIPNTGFSGLTYIVGDMDGNGYSDLINDGTIYLLNENAQIIGTRAGFGDGVVFPMGDLNGDGIDDLISSDEWLVQNRFPGRARILFLNGESEIERFIELANESGSPMEGRIEDEDRFGQSATRIGDLNGDGIDEFAISAPDVSSGKVWVFFQNRDGTTDKVVRIDFPEEIALGTYTAIGMNLAGVGDVNGDSVPDLAVGLPHFGGASDSQAGEGMIQVLFLDSAASVIGRSVFSPLTIDPQIFPKSASLGWLAAPGDLDADGTPDLIVGPANEFSSSVKGFRVLILNPDGSLRAHRLIDQFHGPLQDLFGSAVSAGKYPQMLWDLDGDGLDEIIVDYLDEISGKRGPMVISLASILGAEILPLATVPAAPKEGDNLQIPAVVRSLGRDALSGAQINFRRAGQESFLALDMDHVEGDNWSAEIPGFLLTQQGMEYYISASVPGRADHREPGLGVISVPIRSASPLERIVQGGTAEDGYRMVSIPLQLNETDAMTVLTTSLGEYQQSSWRMFGTDRNVTELNQAPIELAPGSAYWFISRDQRIVNWGIGSSVPTDSVYAINLPTRWSAFGLPFDFELDQSLLTTKSSNAPDIRRYDGTWSVHDTTLVPFEGYAIFNGTGEVDTLYIAPSREVADISGRFGLQSSKTGTHLDWSIPVHARMGRARDIDNVAIAGSSLLNRTDPPPVGNYVRLAFDGEEYPLSEAAKTVDGTAQTWMYNVSSEKAGTVTVQFPDLTEVPDGYAVTLVDPATGIRQDLRGDPTYDVASVGAGIERTLQLEVDPQGIDVAELPTELKLHPAFPNPFTASTTIQYSLPEASNVELTVYDMLGRRVATLAQDEMPAGNHILVWDGRTDHGHDTAPGVYVARFRSAGHAETVTMTRTR